MTSEQSKLHDEHYWFNISGHGRLGVLLYGYDLWLGILARHLRAPSNLLLRRWMLGRRNIVYICLCVKNRLIKLILFISLSCCYFCLSFCNVTNSPISYTQKTHVISMKIFLVLDAMLFELLYVLYPTAVTLKHEQLLFASFALFCILRRSRFSVFSTTLSCVMEIRRDCVYTYSGA